MTGGVIGGLAVFGAGYTYYHFSGIKRAVDVSKQSSVYLEQTKQSIVKHSNEALDYLRQLMKSSVAVVPGSGMAVDILFDSVGQIFEEHREEASAILAKAQEEVESIIKQKDQLTNAQQAAQVMAVVGKHMNEIGRLGAKASGPLLQSVIARLPDKAYLAEKADQSVGLLKGFLGNWIVNGNSE
ncbi:hypothetical protein C8R41DRAFT_864842 [Lentinula lateritia]|uniref:Uncharacterized protein n=1 Tax=Lentinula lateritia TaxID=40482 RepID=A0ABQ8VT23_9AGAR|nr:hypothetical protein C8R41DRAFT_864842 [Lentinula lateritia]